MKKRTKDFIAKVNALIEHEIISEQGLIVDKLGWNQSVLSNVMNGRRDIPEEKYELFQEVFKNELDRLATLTQTSTANEGTEVFMTPMLYYKKMYESEVEKNKLLTENYALMKELLQRKGK